MNEEIKTWTINNKEYDLDDLSDEVKNQIVNLQVVDGEITRLNQQLAIMQTARNAYAKVLDDEIAEKD